MKSVPTVILGMLIGNAQAPENAPRWLLTALDRAQIVQSDDDEPAGFELSFRAERGKAAKQDYELMNSPLLTYGNRVILTVTLNAKPCVLMDGIITYADLAEAGQSGATGVVVKGYDLSMLMDLKEVAKAHKGLGHKEIVQNILNAYAKYKITPKVSEPTSTWTPGPEHSIPIQRGDTDLAYLRELAKQHKFVFRLKPGPTPKQSTAYWGPPERDGKSFKGLTWNMGAATNVESLNFTFDSLSSVKVKGSLASPDGEGQPVEISSSTLKPSLAKDTSLTTYQSFVREVRMNFPGDSITKALSDAQSAVDNKAAAAAKGNGTLDTFRYGEILSAPGKIGVRGAGKNFDGNYMIKKVTHTISRGEYKQSFEIAREGGGSTAKKVQT